VVDGGLAARFVCGRDVLVGYGWNGAQPTLFVPDEVAQSDGH